MSGLALLAGSSAAERSPPVMGVLFTDISSSEVRVSRMGSSVGWTGGADLVAKVTAMPAVDRGAPP